MNARERKERREQRIRENAGQRLGRITGNTEHKPFVEPKAEPFKIETFNIEIPEERAAVPRAFNWRMIHFYLSFISALASLLFPISMFYFLMIVELFFQTALITLNGGLQGSTLSMIASYLPAPFNTYLNLLARYSMIFVFVADDVCAMIVVLGVISLFKS